MKQIVLTSGEITLLDDEDAIYFSYWNWYLNNNGYVYREISVTRTILQLHIEISKRIGIYEIGKDTDQRKEKYRSRIKYNYKQIDLGHFNSPIDAALAYDKKAKELFGEFAYLNFPEEL